MYDDCTGANPADYRGRERINSIGNVRVQEVAAIDFETQQIVRNKETLKELARRAFMKWWAEEFQGYIAKHKEDRTRFDVELMEQLFTSEFRGAYTRWFERQKDQLTISFFEERELRPLPWENASPGPNVRVINTKHTVDSRLYELELVGPQYPGDRFSFEVQIDNSGEAGLRER